MKKKHKLAYINVKNFYKYLESEDLNENGNAWYVMGDPQAFICLFCLYKLCLLTSEDKRRFAVVKHYHFHIGLLFLNISAQP